MAAKIFRINYKSDFILTMNSDAGWAIPFCIKFWTSVPSRAYFVGFDGTTYTHCSYDPSEPTKLVVQFDDHHLPIGDLNYQIAYHFTVSDFPNDTEDEVINPAAITTEIDGETYHVMLDFTGETAPEIEFSLPAYANEQQRISNEQQRISNEQQRISNEQQRVSQEAERVSEYAELKQDAIEATQDANAAAMSANNAATNATNAAASANQAAIGAENVDASLNGNVLSVTNRAGQTTSKNVQGPVGPQGQNGDTGNGIASTVLNSDYTLTITFTNGTTYTTPPIRGAQGEQGVSITQFVPIGESEQSILYNVVFSNGATQQVAIPKGAKGDVGPAGPTGPQGPKGDTVILGDGQVYTLYNVTGQNTDGAMTQKAVTDAIPANIVTGMTRGYTLIALTQAEYDDLGYYDPTVLYFITEATPSATYTLWVGTSTEYDAIETKDSSTIYFIYHD